MITIVSMIIITIVTTSNNIFFLLLDNRKVFIWQSELEKEQNKLTRLY